MSLRSSEHITLPILSRNSRNAQISTLILQLQYMTSRTHIVREKETEGQGTFMHPNLNLVSWKRSTGFNTIQKIRKSSKVIYGDL